MVADIRCSTATLASWSGEALAVGLFSGEAGEASRGQLLERELPQLDAMRRARLLRERQRAPFRDLADLQQRLQLPAALVEELIGRVRFGQGPAGPQLPRSA